MTQEEANGQPPPDQPADRDKRADLEGTAKPPGADVDVTLDKLTLEAAVPPEKPANRSEGASPDRPAKPPDASVTVRDLELKTRPPTLDEMKETGAKTVALVLVWSFAGTILLTFLLACVITSISRGSSETAKVFTDTSIALFEALGKFVSPVFGPLLAFVLGYYFSKEQKGQKQ